MARRKKPKISPIGKEVWYFMILTVVLFLGTLSYSYSKLLCYGIMLIVFLIVLLRYAFNKLNISKAPLFFSAMSSIFLSLLFLQTISTFTAQTYTNFTTLLSYINTSVIVVCGIIFALKAIENVVVQKESINLSGFLFTSIMFSFISLEAAYFISASPIGFIVGATGAFGTNIAVFLLFTSILVILSRDKKTKSK